MPYTDQVIFITDLVSKIVGDFKPARGTGDGWTTLTYQCPEFSGTGVAAGALSGAQPLTLDLGLKGYYVLHVALEPNSSIRVWLDGDKGYREFNLQHGSPAFQECRMWRADMTGKRLHIAVKAGANAKPAGIAYIKAEPAPHVEFRKHNLVGSYDGWSYLAVDGYDTPADIYRLFTPLRDSDVGRILYGPLGADVSTWHKTKNGSTFSAEKTHGNRVCDFVASESTKKLIDQNVDQLAIAVESARDLGIQIHFYIRPEAFAAAHPYDGLFDSEFCMKNPQWRCVDEFGDQILRMSYAYKEVQDHMLAFCGELLDYRPDGICFAFNRSLPMMICEEPVLVEFEKRHGRRPTLPAEVDSPEMLKIRQEILHGFLKRVHDLLRSRRMSMSCIVHGDDTTLLAGGLDLEACLKQQWFDEVYVTSSCKDSAFWERMAKLGTFGIYPNGANWRPDYDQQELAKFTQANITNRYSGAFFWDIETHAENSYNWNVLRKLCDAGFISAFASGASKPPILRPYSFINGVKCGRYHPGNSY